MARKKICTSVYLDAEDYAALAAHAAETRVPAAHYIRCGVRAVLADPSLAQRYPGRRRPVADVALGLIAFAEWVRGAFVDRARADFASPRNVQRSSIAEARARKEGRA